MKKKGLVFFKVLSSLIKKWKKTLLVILVDLLFIASLYILSRVVYLIVPTQGLIGNNTLAGGIIALAAGIGYLFLLILAYTIAKYIVVQIIRNQKIGLEGVFKVFWLNVLIGIILYIVILIVNFVINIFRQSIKNYVFAILLVLFCLFGYSFVQLCHLLFRKDKRVLENLSIGARFLYYKTRLYMEVWFAILVMVLVYALLVLFIGTFFTVTVMQQVELYNLVFTKITYIALFVINLIARYHFYGVIEKHKSSFKK